MRMFLGKNQKGVMCSLKRRGSWFDGCGWIWDTYSNTERILDTLVKRGLVEKTEKGVYKLIDEEK